MSEFAGSFAKGRQTTQNPFFAALRGNSRKGKSPATRPDELVAIYQDAFVEQMTNELLLQMPDDAPPAVNDKLEAYLRLPAEKRQELQRFVAETSRDKNPGAHYSNFTMVTMLPVAPLEWPRNRTDQDEGMTEPQCKQMIKALCAPNLGETDMNAYTLSELSYHATLCAGGAMTPQHYRDKAEGMVQSLLEHSTLEQDSMKQAFKKRFLTAALMALPEKIQQAHPGYTADLSALRVGASASRA